MMNLMTWKPMRELFDTSSKMDRIFDDFFKPAHRRVGSGSWDWLPAVDILEADDHVEIRAEIPGLSEDDIHVSVTDDVLTLKGEKKHESEEKAGRYHRVERSYGHFQRAFSLPADLNAEEIKATFKDGVLTVSVPKTETAKPKEIPISTK